MIPELRRRAKPGGVYLGVGPEQNFTYIAAVRPRMAFIVDIRRGNLQEHLLYKALLEMSADRAEFLVAAVFARAAGRPDARTSTVRRRSSRPTTPSAPSEDLYRANLKAVMTLAHDEAHASVFSEDDPAGIDYVYRTAFFQDGPRLGYALTGHGRDSARRRAMLSS